MRLLTADTLELETFADDAAAPPFAILSHTWGPDEVTLQDLQLPEKVLARRNGWHKITRFRDAVAAHPRLLARPARHLWVDTACIDKTSSAELSEAINSMFRWYRGAACCFAVLGDVEAPERGQPVGQDFEASRWFTRGWTLQELLAPRDVHFFDRDWVWLGSKASLAGRIAARTGIAQDIVVSGEWPFATVAQRMSWVSGRVTTRVEDMAYCLLGIFGVNMPMLYGEGERAFARLQEEIIKDSDDESILAWDASDVPASVRTVGVLASHPRQFRGSAGIESVSGENNPFALTNKGLYITLPIIEHPEEPGKNVALLSCLDVKDPSSLIGIHVRQDRLSRKSYSRMPGPPLFIPARDPAVWGADAQDIYIAKRDQGLHADKRLLHCQLLGPSGPLAGLKLIRLNPSDSWYTSKAKTMTMAVPRVDPRAVAGATSALLFNLTGTEHAFFLVLDIQPLTRAARVGLVVCPAKLPEGEALDPTLGRMRTDAATIATAARAELTFGTEKVIVRTAPGGPSLLKITLSRILMVCDSVERGSAVSAPVKGGSTKGGPAKSGSAKGGPATGGPARGESAKGRPRMNASAKTGSRKNGTPGERSKRLA